MSVLESRAKPFLSRMIEGTSTRFEQADADIVASWAVKTAMVFERMYRSQVQYYLPDEILAFRFAPHNPPDETIVLAASYHGQCRASMAFERMTMNGIAGDGPTVDGRYFTLQFGQMVLQVRSNHWKRVTGNPAFVAGGGMRVGQWLWPTHQPVDWPQPPILSGSELNDFASRQFRVE